MFPFYTSLETSENLWFSGLSRRYKIGMLTSNGLSSIQTSLHCFSKKVFKHMIVKESKIWLPLPGGNFSCIHISVFTTAYQFFITLCQNSFLCEYWQGINYQIKWTQSDLIARQILLRHIVGKQSQNQLKWLSKGSCPEVFCKKGFLKNFAKFTDKDSCWSLFFIKLHVSEQKLC